VCNVADPKPWLEAATLVEPVHPRIFAAALQQHVMTVFDPSCSKGSVNNSTSVTSALKFRMGDNIFEKAVPPAAPQEIWCGD